MAKKVKIDIAELDGWLLEYASALDLDSKFELIYKYHTSDNTEITLELYLTPYNTDEIEKSYYLTIPIVDGKIMSVETWLAKYKNSEIAHKVLLTLEKISDDITEIHDKIAQAKRSIKFYEARLEEFIDSRAHFVEEYKKITGDDYDTMFLDHGDED